MSLAETVLALWVAVCVQMRKRMSVWISAEKVGILQDPLPTQPILWLALILGKFQDGNHQEKSTKWCQLKLLGNVEKGDLVGRSASAVLRRLKAI